MTMEKHDFDPVSFVFGALFLLGGIPLLISDSGFDFFEQKWVFPAFLVIAGLVVLATSQFSDRHADGEESEDPVG